jgi:hypothetical protein
MGSSKRKPFARTVDSCQEALKSALATVQNMDCPKSGRDEDVKTALAKNIAEFAAIGETDPQRLSSCALRKYFLDQWNWLSPTPSLFRPPRRRRPTKASNEQQGHEDLK